MAKNIPGSRIICAKIVDVNSPAIMSWIIKAILRNKQMLEQSKVYADD
jgi:hypothetical protein